MQDTGDEQTTGVSMRQQCIELTVEEKSHERLNRPTAASQNAHLRLNRTTIILIVSVQPSHAMYWCWCRRVTATNRTWTTDRITINESGGCSFNRTEFNSNRIATIQNTGTPYGNCSKAHVTSRLCKGQIRYSRQTRRRQFREEECQHRRRLQQQHRKKSTIKNIRHTRHNILNVMSIVSRVGGEIRNTCMPHTFMYTTRLWTVLVGRMSLLLTVPFS